MIRALGWIGKTVLVWIAILAGAVIGGLLFPVSPEAGSQAEPLSAGQALLIVGLVDALVLILLAKVLRGEWARKFFVLFVTMVVVEPVLSFSEALIFGASVQMPAEFLLKVGLGNAVKAALGAAAAASLFRSEASAAERPVGLAWKVPAIIALYLVAYFGAGQFIAWQSETVRAYYGDGALIPPQGLLILAQIVRGLVWAAIAILLFANLHGSTVARGLLIGSAFAFIMAVPLLFPNGYMPWPVRQVHFVEIAVSNFLFGIASAFVLGFGAISDRTEVKKTLLTPS